MVWMGGLYHSIRVVEEGTAQPRLVLKAQMRHLHRFGHLQPLSARGGKVERLCRGVTSSPITQLIAAVALHVARGQCNCYAVRMTCGIIVKSNHRRLHPHGAVRCLLLRTILGVGNISA